MSGFTPGWWHLGGIFNPDSDRPSTNIWGPTPVGKQSGEIVAKDMTLPNARLVLAQQKVCAEILDIIDTYHSQEEEGYVDTPGGLEHLSDVWRLFAKWEQMLRTEGSKGTIKEPSR